MATIAQRILHELKHGDALDDDVLARRLGIVRQSVNQNARFLEAQGRLQRYAGPDGKIVNQIREAVISPP